MPCSANVCICNKHLLGNFQRSGPGHVLTTSVPKTSDRVPAFMKLIPKMNPRAVSLLTPAGIWFSPIVRMMETISRLLDRADLGTLGEAVTISLTPF